MLHAGLWFIMTANNIYQVKAKARNTQSKIHGHCVYSGIPYAYSRSMSWCAQSISSLHTCTKTIESLYIWVISRLEQICCEVYVPDVDDWWLGDISSSCIALCTGGHRLCPWLSAKLPYLFLLSCIYN